MRLEEKKWRTMSRKHISLCLGDFALLTLMLAMRLCFPKDFLNATAQGDVQFIVNEREAKILETFRTSMIPGCKNISHHHTEFLLSLLAVYFILRIRI